MFRTVLYSTVRTSRRFVSQFTAGTTIYYWLAFLDVTWLCKIMH